jgi:hypothetical protein
MRLPLVLLLCLSIAGCAMQPVAPEKATQYKRIGILSALGDRFSIGAVGITVFGNDYREEHLDLGADEILTARASDGLSPRYAMTDLGRYRASFLGTKLYWPGGRKLIGEDREAVGEAVRRIMGAEGLDAYILIWPGVAAVSGTNQGVPGIGIVKLPSGLFGSGGTYLLHAAYFLTVVDGKDFSVAAVMRAVPIGEGNSAARIFSNSRLNAPNVPVSVQNWQEPARYKEMIKSALEALIAKSMQETLSRAQLIGK